MKTRRRLGSGEGYDCAVGDNGGRQLVKRSMAGSIIDIDDILTKRLAICANCDSTYGFMRPFMKVLELSCHGVPWIVGSVLAVFVSHQAKTQEKFLNLLMALFVDIIIVAVIKLVVRRSRPQHNQMDMLTIMSIDSYSFPSGHATRTAMVICFLLGHFSLWPSWAAVLVLWSIAVPLSRVFLGRHYILDIVSGIAIGFLQYRYIIQHLWLSSETCETILRPIHEELHI